MSTFLLSFFLLSTLVFLLVRLAGRGDAPSPGSHAPGFELKDAEGRVHLLEDYSGQWLVLYFYPRDETPGCTRQACGLRDNLAEFRRRDVAILGVSLDDPASHAAFAKHHSLPFPLLSDPQGRVATAYGALWNLGLVRFAKRHTYLIDPEGRVVRTFLSVSPATHAAMLLAEIDRHGLEPCPAAANNPGMPLHQPSSS